MTTALGSYVLESFLEEEELVAVGEFHWASKLGATLLVPVLVGIGMWVRILTTEVAVTDRRLIVKRGWIARKSEELQLAKVEEVNLRQSAWGRVLGYGQVAVMGTGLGEVVLPVLARPMELKQAIQQAQARAAGAREG